MRIVYVICYSITRIIFFFLQPVRVTGREKIPPGPAVVCAPHSSYTDPVLIAHALTLRHKLYFMAKAELFRVPLLGPLITALGAYSTDRSSSGLGAVRTSMRLLKEGKKILIFPEGTRLREDSVNAKTGAIRLAQKLGVPILPVYLPRDKKPFRRLQIAIGDPYHIEKGAKPGPEDYDLLASRLMERIYNLRDGVN